MKSLNPGVISKAGLCIKLGRGHWHACVGTWGRETRDLGTSSMERGDMWDGDAGRQIQGRGGRRDVNEYLSQYLFLRKYVLFMVNIRFHRLELLWTPYDVYTKYSRT